MDCFMDCLAIAAKMIMHLSLTKRAVIKMRNQLKKPGFIQYTLH